MRRSGVISVSEEEVLRDHGSWKHDRRAAVEVGVSPDVGYRWVKHARLSAQRATQRVYSDADKAKFFRLLAEQSNVSAVARQLGFVRVTCYKWAHQAGVFTGRSVDVQRDEFSKLRSERLSVPTPPGGSERTSAQRRIGTTGSASSTAVASIPMVAWSPTRTRQGSPR